MSECFVISRYGSMSIEPYRVVFTIEAVEKIIKIELYNDCEYSTPYKEFQEFKLNDERHWTDGEGWSVDKVVIDMLS